MGNFFKNFRVLFLLSVFTLFAAACSEEPQMDPNEVSLEVTEEATEVAEFPALDPPNPEDLGFIGEGNRYQKVTAKEDFGYDAFIDLVTFRFAEPPGYMATQLTEKDLQDLAQWRSPKGVPWTAWALGSDLSFESHETFSIRAITGAYAMSNEVLEKVTRFLVQEEGLEPADAIVGYISRGGDYPAGYEAQNPIDLFYALGGWFRENVAASSVDLYSGVFETYAWYTSPTYKKGTLPAEIEEAMELMKKGELADDPPSIPIFEEIAERAVEIVKGTEIPTPEGPFYASTSDLVFLQKDKNIAALGFYRDLLDVLEGISNDPEAFPEFRPRFERLLESFPDPERTYLKKWADNVLFDLILMEESKGLPIDQMVETATYGELPVGNLKDIATSDVEIFAGDVRAFIRQWSDLQSSGD